MNAPRLRFERHFHPAGEYRFTPDTLTLSFAFSRTKVEMIYDGRRWNGTSLHGDIKVMPSAQLRTFRHRQGCRFGHIVIDERSVFAGEVLKGLQRPYPVLRDAPLRHVLSALWTESELGPTTSLFQDAVAEAVVARLAELDNGALHLPEQQMPPHALRRVLEFLDTHIARDMSVEQLAAIAGLSPAHFSALFRNSVGEPPHRYHIRLRVERARALLQRGMTPSAAAVAVGFYDHSHLGRHMRRVLGASPTAFLRRP